MKALVVEKVNQISCKEVDRPVPKTDEVLVRVKAAGLCGSDFHIFHGTYPAKYPLIPGHEFSGVIEEVGSAVKGWQKGQRVTADPNIYCHHCHYCLIDQENMCENAEAIGVTRDGGFADFVAVPCTQLYELSDNITFEEGAVIEPLACAIYGMQRLNMTYGSSAVVFGAGPVGLLLMQTLKSGGAGKIVMVDLEQQRLERAVKLGADMVFTSVAQVRAALPYGADVVVDATGNAKAIEDMFKVAAKRAKLLQFGCADAKIEVNISPFDIYNNDWEYIGTKTAVFTFERAINMLAGKRVTALGIISEVTTLDKLAAYLQNGKPSSALKIIAQP